MAALVLSLAGCVDTGPAPVAPASVSTSAASAASGTAAGVPRPDHVLVVVLENHAYGQIIGNPDAPYLNDTLKAGGADLTDSHAITHPSAPNYYALFSGSTQGRTDDSCVPVGSLTTPNLGAELLAAGRSWASYNEALPARGSTVCSSGEYAQKHNPWFGFGNVPTATAYTFAQFPADYTKLPTVGFVIPDLCDDMHDCSVATGDTWLRNNLGGYASWAQSHNSLLVVTFDEDDNGPANLIPTLLYGQPVRPGSSSATAYTHYSLLRTLEDLAGLPGHAGAAGAAEDIAGIWR
ncbi:alkaline phosphatase family protein [Kitasatospora sp. LaBMicrA B282]|uniref:alkaline phosphatase family protein n=1 Tax=Kitasatospora sp. LaBMicrA B282 TaxID=3420949 RepID=UPI003D0DC678